MRHLVPFLTTVKKKKKKSIGFSSMNHFRPNPPWMTLFTPHISRQWFPRSAFCFSILASVLHHLSQSYKNAENGNDELTQSDRPHPSAAAVTFLSFEFCLQGGSVGGVGCSECKTARIRLELQQGKAQKSHSHVLETGPNRIRGLVCHKFIFITVITIKCSCFSNKYRFFSAGATKLILAKTGNQVTKNLKHPNPSGLQQA